MTENPYEAPAPPILTPDASEGEAVPPRQGTGYPRSGPSWVLGVGALAAWIVPGGLMLTLWVICFALHCVLLRRDGRAILPLTLGLVGLFLYFLTRPF